MVTLLIIGIAVAFVAAMAVHEEKAIARETRAREHRAAALKAALYTATDARRSGYAPDYRTPDHQIVAWTPAEREAFGVNDTMRFIEETDRVIKDHEWKQILEKQKAAEKLTTAALLGDTEIVRSHDGRVVRNVATGFLY